MPHPNGGSGLSISKILGPPIHAGTQYEKQQPKFCVLIKLNVRKTFIGSTTPYPGQNFW